MLLLYLSIENTVFSTYTSWQLLCKLLQEKKPTRVCEVFQIKSQVVYLSENDLNTKMHAKELSISFAWSVLVLVESTQGEDS